MLKMNELDIHSLQNLYENNKEGSLSSSTAEDAGISRAEGNCDSEDESSENRLVHSTSSEILQERIVNLRNSMSILRNQLKEEREMWKKEVEEAIRISQSTQVQALDEPLSKSSIDLSHPCHSSKEFTFAEYEQQLQEYKYALARAEAEKRATLKRQIAISNYKRRLLEVENMCNLELLRVKQSIQFLQPLQMISSEWNLNKNDTSQSEAISDNNAKTNIPSECGDGDSSVSEAIIDAEEQKQQLPAEIEMFTNKLYSDMNNMFTKLAPSSLSVNMQPVVMNEEFTARSQTSLWYSNESLAVSKF